MCDVMTALAVAGGVSTFVGGQSAASAQSDAARDNLNAQYAQANEKRKQINEEKALDTNQRKLQGLIDRAESKAIAGESGALGFNTDRLLTDSFFQEGIDLASIEQNRSNLMKQSEVENQSAWATGQSTANTAYANAPGAIDTGLAIAGTVYKGRQAERTKTLGPKIQNYPTYA